MPVEHADLYYEAVGGEKEKFIVAGADHTFNRHEWEKAVITRPLIGSAAGFEGKGEAALAGALCSDV